MFERFNGNVVPFADESTSTNRTVFGSETQSDDIDDNLNSDFKKGWEIVGLNDNPTREDFNAMGYTLGYLTSYLYQNGVAEYNLLQEYKTNSIAIGADGNIYQSLVDNNLGNDLTDTTKWVCIASKNSIVNSIAELKTISNIESINVLGYYEKGDGGGGIFYWDATSTEADNGGTIIQATGVTTGRWKRVFSGAVNVKWFGAKGDGVTDDYTAIQNVCNLFRHIRFPKGNYQISNQLDITETTTIYCENNNEYDGGGTIFTGTFDDASKSVMYARDNIVFTLKGTPLFQASSSSLNIYAGLRVEAPTVFIDGIRSNTTINGFYFKNCYIGEVKNISGTGKTFLLKVTGDTSLVFTQINAGASAGGLASLQFDECGGYIRIDKIYLEAQTQRNMSITNSNRGSFHINSVYGENSSFYDILIDYSENIVIENYRTNTATETLKITNSSNVKINNIHALDRISRNEVVSIDYNSHNIYVGGLLYDPVSTDGVAVREYVLVRGKITGKPVVSNVVNPTLELSANRNVSTVGGVSVSTDIPTGYLRMSGRSINVNNANPLKIPFTKWKAGSSVVVQVIYKCSSIGESAVTIPIYVNGNTELIRLDYFHEASDDFQLLTFVTRIPTNTTIVDQYSSLEFRCASGATAIVHYLSMSYYDGGMLPLGAIDDSIVFSTDNIDLSVTNSSSLLISKFGGRNYRFKKYELLYTENTGASGTNAVIDIGDANSSGVLAASYANFTTSANSGRGSLATTLTQGGSYPFRDHFIGGNNGWIANVRTASTYGGKAKVVIHATPIEIQ